NSTLMPFLMLSIFCPVLRLTTYNFGGFFSTLNFSNTLLALFLCLCLFGCSLFGVLQESMQQADAVSQDLEKVLGTKPFVGFNWNNGSLTSVNIQFQGFPQKEKSLEKIGEVAKKSVMTHFKSKAEQLVISFVIKKQ
ncbi:hypothetical protein V2H45_16545, partial [Tumidithrix elongata RA019]|nr:hypothetical protein [Tumidithrix elongata RA019]